jgi:hypothetical protein
VANEIKFFLSGGGSNQNPFLSIGGGISNTEILNGLLNNLWSDVSESDTNNGITDHRVIFIKNVSGAALADMRAYFGELDNFMGMAILSTTTTNTAVAQLAAATDAVNDFFTVWDNTGETPSTKMALNNTTKRSVLYISTPMHQAYNQFPDMVQILMAKTGAPTGTAAVKVWAMSTGLVPAAGDNTVIRTLGTIDVTTLTTTMAKYTFNTPADLVQNPLPSVGWRIGIEYTAGTATAHVDVGQTAPAASLLSSTDATGATQMWVPIMVVRTDDGAAPFNSAQSTGHLIADEFIETLSDVDAFIGYDENGDDQLGWIDLNQTTQDGEICDVCEVHSNADHADFSDGLRVPYYYDNATKKCIAPGAGSAVSIPNPQPNITNHGAISPPAAKLVLVFWGTTWASGSSSYKATVVDDMQNKLLNTHKSYFNQGMTDYGFGMPAWSQAAIWNQDLPAGGNSYTTTEMATALQNAIESGTLTDPGSSIFVSQNTNISNLVYCIIPDPTWSLNIDPQDDDFVAFHTTELHTSTTAPPPNPDPNPTPDPNPSPSPLPITYQGGFTQSWDGTKWVDFATNEPCIAIFTNHGPCFQTGNPPPPGGGTPPPGTCDQTAPAQGTMPNAGGGGGVTQHGYVIKTATDNGNDGNVAANTIDHNLSTRWSQDSTNAQLTLDMGAANPVHSVKIAWYKGDERKAKFNLAYSTDNSSYTTIKPQGGASFMAGGHSLQLEEFSFIADAGTSTNTVSGVTTVSVTLEVPWLAMQTGDNPGGTSAAFIVRDLADELLECITNPITNGAGADKGWLDNNDFEIVDLCENHSNAETATFTDGLQVPYYWDTSTRKCVAPGAASTGVSISENPNYTNHGGPVIGSPVVYLIFWGPTWTSQTTFKNSVIDLVQNKLLGTDASTFFATARADYNLNSPTWGGSATNTNSPANTNSYTSADVMVAITQAINAGTVPNPASNAFAAGSQKCSQIVYAVIPDLSWHALVNNSDNSIAEAIHLSMTFTTQTGDPNPPPPPPPPPPTGVPPVTPGPQPFSARYIRYTGLGNTVNTWNSVTEFEIWGPDAPGGTPSPPPTPGGGGLNYSKPSSYDTGIVVPNLNDGDFVAIHLERVIPPETSHVELENYSIVISNSPTVNPPVDEPIPGLPGGGGGGPGPDPNLPPPGEIPLPTPPGVFDPGTIPPPEPVPPPVEPPTGQCPGDPNQPPPTPDPGGGGEPPPTPGGGGTGTTPDGIKLVELPAGFVYADQHTNFHENFQSNGSFRLDCGVQPQMDQCNLTFSLNLSSGSDEISSKLSGGTHTDSKPKNGRCYDIGINQAGDRVRIRKEDPHPDYHDATSHSIKLGSLNGKWIYVQSLKWNEGSNCHLQCWIDTSGSQTVTNQFVKILDDIDTGGWFESPYLHVFDSSDSQTTVRVDGMSTSKFHYQKLCLTRIQPG